METDGLSVVKHCFLIARPSRIIKASRSITRLLTPVLHHLSFVSLWYFFGAELKICQSNRKTAGKPVPSRPHKSNRPCNYMSPLRLSNECQCSSPGEKELVSNYSSGLRVLSIVRLPCLHCLLTQREYL